MYSVYTRGEIRQRERHRKARTFATDTKIACTDLVAELALLLARHLLVFLWAWTPVLWLEDLEGCGVFL